MVASFLLRRARSACSVITSYSIHYTKLYDTSEDRDHYSPDQYLIGTGRGDMAKGPIVCQRVSELSARTDLAKQIRILVKEHMVDRIRERTGREAEQDIEVTREEIVQES